MKVCHVSRRVKTRALKLYPQKVDTWCSIFMQAVRRTGIQRASCAEAYGGNKTLRFDYKEKKKRQRNRNAASQRETRKRRSGDIRAACWLTLTLKTDAKAQKPLEFSFLRPWNIREGSSLIFTFSLKVIVLDEILCFLFGIWGNS